MLRIIPVVDPNRMKGRILVSSLTMQHEMLCCSLREEMRASQAHCNYGFEAGALYFASEQTCLWLMVPICELTVMTSCLSPQALS